MTTTAKKYELKSTSFVVTETGTYQSITFVVGKNTWIASKSTCFNSNDSYYFIVNTSYGRRAVGKRFETKESIANTYKSAVANAVEENL